MMWTLFQNNIVMELMVKGTIDSTIVTVSNATKVKVQ